MSPTSCRCSTPRRVLGAELGAIGSSLVSSARPRRLAVCGPRVRGARGGLASRGVAPTVLSGAALGHDRVRDGTGWGQHALGHGHPPPPHRRRGPCSAPRPRERLPAPGGSPSSWRVAHAPCIAPHHASPRGPIGPARRGGMRSSPGEVSSPPPGAGRPAAAHRHWRETFAGGPPSTIRTARLQSVARGPPAAYRPGHLPGVLPRKEWGCSSWGGIPA